MSKNNQYAVETFSLTKIFSDLWGRAKVYAVNELNLKVRYNEVFGLLGPNGSGKTTAIKLLLGLLHATKGKSLVLGGDATSAKISARIGFLPEESYLYRYLTARETLDFYGRLFSLPSKVRKMRIEALLEMVGLKAVANRQVGTFSKGMARRIGLAQALINDPDLLILDEPTTGLDPIGTRQIKDLILELAKRGKTVLLCSHLLADVEDVCDRISILYGGRIQAQGKVRQLLQQTNKTQITAKSLSGKTIEDIKQLVQAEDVDFEIVSPMEKLETFFIRTVTEAQAHATPTSGAVSTTQLGEFLTAEAAQKKILDKLVSAEVVEKVKSPVAETHKPAEIETPAGKPDEEILSKLASGPELSEPTETSEPCETEIPDTEEVRRDVLEQLTGSEEDQKKQNQAGTTRGTHQMHSIWAVARNTIRQALRMKIAAAFVLLLLILIPVMGLAITGDGTIKGRLQSFTTYSLAMVSLLLSLLTIIVATYSLADDIKQRRIYTVLTKPIRRFELLLGKLLGVIGLNLLLLVPLSSIIYGVTKYIPVHYKADAQQMQSLQKEFFTARASLKPPQPDVTAEAFELYEQLKKEDRLPQGISPQEIVKNLILIKRMEKRAAGVGRELRWEFDNIRIADPNQSLFVRFKYDVVVNPPDLNIYGVWAAGDLRQLPMIPQGPGSIYFFERRDLIRTFRELEIPANAVASDGHLEVSFLNDPRFNNTVVIFPPEDGMELLYKADNYGANFIRAVLIIFFRLVFLACLGILAASFLSFPVAILLCLAVFFTAMISGFILESFDMMSKEIGGIYKVTVGLLIHMMPRFDQYSAATYLVPARLISWSLIAKIAGLMVCLQSFVIFLLAILVFKFREIAKIVV